MLIERKHIKDMDRAAYNPRVELRPGDEEYEALRHSIETYGLLIPIVWNKRTNRVVGGHQRLTVLENNGETETDVSVVDLDELKEKELNIALNKAQGTWDDARLAEMLDSLGDRAQETGFTLPEIEALESRIEDALDETFLDDELGAIEQTFNITFDFPIAEKEAVHRFIKEHGKEDLVGFVSDTAHREEE